MTPSWKHIVAALLIGCLVGAAAGSRYQRWAFHKFWQQGPDPQRVLKKFTKELNLDAKQREAVKAILEKHHEEVVGLHRDMSAKFDEIRTSMRSEIKPLLTPEQQKKFEAMVARWDARHKRLEGGQKAPPVK